MSPKNETPILILSLLLTLVILGGGYWLVKDRLFPKNLPQTSENQSLPSPASSSISQSLGNTLLIPSDTTFSQDAVNLWGGSVNWRSALAYDATQALITALGQNTTRQGIQQVLADRNFSSQGATGTIRFLPSGDRHSRPLFVKVISQPQSKSNTGFDFVLIPLGN